ncbi:hypothetical protein LY28_01918 [Ruminiclostridium sufflavum DSM 19573]|uniref:Uncharacterized protein n=1 Tax=Ruminiclostridium sufflavum DSM 19573 TaxID=1121337 RepID=A0A318XJQ0_9FIRM|nr:hypothetical protein [Ruminiclostridium sufflavum]PYG87550.1 hypothetical protein LY28_01918 [Ruminiclostridium sufflavum DSM 19573]
MNNKTKAVLILLASASIMAGCSKYAEDCSFQTAEQMQEPQVNQLKELQKYNKFFFKDISIKNEYSYTGTVWGDNIFDRDSDNTDGYNNIKVKAKLKISQIAELSKGSVFEFNFSVMRDGGSKEEICDKYYLWVTEDNIFSFNPSKKTTDKNLYENGKFNYINYAKELEATGQLPDNDKTFLLSGSEDIYLNDGIWKTAIIVRKNVCTYTSNNSENSSNTKFIWDADRGLVYYSWGQGAKAAGIELYMDEAIIIG